MSSAASDFPRSCRVPPWPSCPPASTQTRVSCARDLRGQRRLCAEGPDAYGNDPDRELALLAGAPPIATVHLLSSPRKRQSAGLPVRRPGLHPIADGMPPGSPTTRSSGPRCALNLPSVEYYGFNHQGPFNDVHVRRAFELGQSTGSALSRSCRLRGGCRQPACAPGSAGSQLHGLRAGLRPRLRQVGTQRGGLSGWCRLPEGHLDHDRRGLRPARRAIVRQLHDNLGIDISYRAEGWDLYNSLLLSDARRSGRWIGSPTTQAPTTSSVCCLDPASRTISPVDQLGLHSAIKSALSSTDAASIAEGLRLGPVDRQGSGPGDPRQLRLGYSLVARACSGDAEQPGAGPVRRTCHGFPDHETALLHPVGLRVGAALSCSLLIAMCLPARGPQHGHIRHAIRNLAIRPGDRVHAAVRRPLRSSRQAPHHSPRRPGPTVAAVSNVGSGSLTYAMDTSSGEWIRSCPCRPIRDRPHRWHDAGRTGNQGHV